MALSPGTRLGAYEITSAIGAGGMGEVYRATDSNLKRSVAIKVLPAPVADDQDRLARFQREAEVLAALNHPNVAAVYGLEKAGDVTALVMELVEGEDLSQRIARGAIPIDEALPIAKQIAEALEAAHEQGIIHRDLKPANIKVRADGTVKVLDFGLAKALTQDPRPETQDPRRQPAAVTVTSPAVTQAGIILGTAAYMSPEQARGKAVDRRTDIWALGVVMFELLSGSQLFEGESVSDTIAAVLRQDIPWDRLPSSTPPRLQRLLRQCLERDPRNRLRDAGDVRIEIDDLTRSPADDTQSAASAEVLPVRASRTLERALWAALVVGAAGLGWWLRPSATATAESAWSQFTQLTDEAGREVTPAISPDGSSIAYATDVSGSWDVYVRRIGGRTATRVAADPARDEGAPAFSPDGRFIAFHEADTDGGIFIVGATGESERRITNAGFHPAWSRDGKSIAFCQERVVSPTSRVIESALSIVDVATGAVRVVTKGDAVQPAWSSSNDRIAYWGNSAGGQRDIYTIAVAGGDPVKVTDDAALDWAPEWAPDGKHLYFVSDRGGAMNLWRIAIDERSARASGSPEPVTSGVQATVARPSFSNDGSRLVFSSEVSSANPVALPLDAATSKVGEPRFLLRQSRLLAPTSVSPDGSMLAYYGSASSEDIWVSRIDGTGLRRVTDDEYRDRVPLWSPDGNELVFYSNRSGKYEIWTIKKDGSGATQISNQPHGSVNWPFYDSANRRIWAYLVIGANASYTYPLNEKRPHEGIRMPPIPIEGGTFRPHAITRDGKRLAGLALSADAGRLGVGWHDLVTGETWISREGTGFSIPSWLDEQQIVFAVNGSYLAVIDTAKKRRIIGGPFSFEPTPNLMPAVSPDRRTLFVGGVTTEADVWMVERAKGG